MLSWLRRLLAPPPRHPLTWRARWALHAAVGHAERRGAGRAGAADLLYGLARADEGVGRAMLADLGVGLEDLVPPGEEPLATARLPPAVDPGRWDDQVERVMGWARAEARRAGHRYVGTEHLVLGLLRGAGSDAGRLLRDRGASLPEARGAMHRIIGDGPCEGR